MIALIADADRLETNAITNCLKNLKAHFKVSFTIKEALFQAKTSCFDLVISEVLLPDGDGYQLCRTLRAAKINTPLLFLSKKDSTKSKLAGFAAGGDDYLTKPYHEEELIARIKALIRRGNSIAPETLVYKKLSLNTNSNRIFIGNTEVKLTNTLFETLKYLLRHQDEVVTREELIEKVWCEDPVNIRSNSVETHIKLLRQYIGERLHDKFFIKTIWGKGYRIDSF